MIWSKPKNRRKSEGAGFRINTALLARFGIAAVVLAALGIAVTLTVSALDQNITQVSVTGRFQRVSPIEVEQAVKARVRDIGLVSVDLAAVRRAVEQLPGVDSATGERQWPRALNIRVTEQVAAARWGANGLLNTRGELFISEARHIPPELPRLSGPRGAEGEVARRYLSAQGQLIDACGLFGHYAGVGHLAARTRARARAASGRSPSGWARGRAARYGHVSTVAARAGAATGGGAAGSAASGRTSRPRPGRLRIATTHEPHRQTQHQAASAHHDCSRPLD